jgi:hypothetical protein
MVAPAASWMPVGELSRRTGVSSDLLRKRQQAAAGVTLVRDCGAVPEAVPPPEGSGLPTFVSCGPLIAPEIQFLAHLRTPVPPDRLVDVALERIRGGSTWIKLLADAPGPDGNMLAATPTLHFSS